MIKIVFIVDEDKSIRGGSLKIRQLEEFNVETMTTGWEALKKVRKNRFNLVIFDIVLS